MKKFKVNYYPSKDNEGNSIERSEKFEAQRIEETDNGNIIFRKSGETIGVIGRGSFESIKEVT